MAGITTAFPTQTKSDLLNGGAHILAAPVTLTGTISTGAKTVTGLSSTAGLFRGMSASGSNVAAGAIIKSVDSSTQVTLSDVGGANASPSITFSGDTFKIALIKVSPTGTYGAASTKYGDITGNSDEVSGTGYTAGGQVLATNLGAQVSGTTAYTQWSTNPSWTGATISTTGAMIYNTAAGGSIPNAAVGVFDFGGTQTVTAGTLTLLQPANDNTHALLRIA